MCTCKYAYPAAYVLAKYYTDAPLVRKDSV